LLIVKGRKAGQSMPESAFFCRASGSTTAKALAVVFALDA
jgi:hypothetical protein